MVDEGDDLVLHALEASDGGAELDAGAAVIDGDLVDGLTSADLVGADDGDGLGDGALPGAPAAGDAAAEYAGGVGGGVVEADLGQVPGEAVEAAGTDASGVGGDDDEADILGLLGADGAEVVGGGTGRRRRRLLSR